MQNLTRALTAVAMLLSLACGGTTDPAKSSVTTITLSFNKSTLSLHAFESMGPSFRDASGATVATVSDVAWKSSNTAVATVDKTGHVTAVGLGGPVTITVTAGTATATATFSVTPDKIILGPTPLPTTLGVGVGLQLSGTAADISGAAITSGAAIVWSTSNAAVASVGASSGLVTGVGAGNVTITATAAGKSIDLQLEVGVISAYDGNWSGANDNGSRPIVIKVVFGTIRYFSMTYFLFPAPYASSCAASVAATGAPNTPITGAQFSFNLSTPATAVITGTFTSTTQVTGTHNAIALGSFSCNILESGQSVPNTVMTANIPASTFTATKQP